MPYKYNPAAHISLICPVCGITFDRLVNQLKYLRHFESCCSNHCAGVLRGRTLAAPLEVRFWQHVVKDPAPDGCWIWRGGKPKDYGTIELRGCTLHAHRVAWELHNGPIPAGLHVLHTCDVRRCVRPGHLFLGTTRDNQLDCVKKGRNNPLRGEASRLTRFTAAEVLAMRGQYDAGGVSITELARQRHCSVANAWAIVRHKSWKHLP